MLMIGILNLFTDMLLVRIFYSLIYLLLIKTEWLGIYTIIIIVSTLVTK